MPVPDDYFVEPNKVKQFNPIPSDKYQVMIYDVNPIQEQNFKGDGMVDKLDFSFVVLDDKKFTSRDERDQPIEESTRGRRLWRKVPRSFVLGKKYRSSLFYELMCAIEKKQLNEDEMVKIQPNTLIGQQLSVFVSIKDQWNNIDSFLPITKDLEPMNTVLDLDPSEQGVKGKPSTENPKSADDFIKGLKEDKDEEVSEEQAAEIFSKS